MITVPPPSPSRHRRARPLKARGPSRLAAGLALATMALVPMAALAQPQPAELTGAAWTAADNAYAALREKRYADAAASAREALKLRPDAPQLWLVLMEALEWQGKLDEAVAVGREALAAGITDQALIAHLRSQSSKLAQAPGLEANKALEAGKPKVAADAARKAIALVPDALTYRMQLVYALIADGQLAAAEKAAGEAIETDPQSFLPRTLRGYLRMRQGNFTAAEQDFDAALNDEVLAGASGREVRLVIADAAIAAGHPDRAIRILDALGESDNLAVAARLDVARKQQRDPGTVPAQAWKTLPVPYQKCVDTPYGPSCSLWPAASPPGATVVAGLNPASPGYAAAAAGYAAFARRDYAGAVRDARRAIAAEPGNVNYHLLLLNALTASHRYDEAEAVAKRLLASGRLPASQVRLVRLSLADAALSAKRPELALWALEPFAREDSYEVQARLGYAYLALDDKEGALNAFTRAGARARSAQERNAMLTARIGLLAQLGRKEEARQLFLAAYDSGALRGMKAVDLALLASQAGEDDIAFQYFSEAAGRWQLRGTNLVNAAYNARRTYHNEVAVDYFKAAIDEAREGKLKLDPQYLFGLRREVAELTRTWGAYLSVSYGPVGIAPGSPLVPPTGAANRTIGAGGEIYWRPPGIGYRDGAIFELFVRGFGTLYDQSGGPTGFDTIQGAVGARWKPFKTENLVLEASYLFPVGQYANDDVLLRVAYSKAEGTDLRVDVDNWRAWQIYGDYNYFVSTPQTIATFEGRYGHAFRLDAISDRLVLWPYLAIGGGYDTSLATPFALGAGPGATLRYWFNEDEYAAPRSYLDLTLQYRFKLAGDDRAEGVVAGAFLSY